MKIQECLVKVKESGVVLLVKNDGHHYRAFNPAGEQVGNPWVHITSLLDELKAETVTEEEAEKSGIKTKKDHTELEKMKTALAAAGESFEDNLEEFRNTYQDFPQDARAMAEGIGCDYEALVKEVEALKK